jgi:hypothetical protein
MGGFKNILSLKISQSARSNPRLRGDDGERKMIKDLFDKLYSKKAVFFENLFNDFQKHLLKTDAGKVVKNDNGLLPVWSGNKLKALVFRNNVYFETNDMTRNNDVLVLIEDYGAGYHVNYYHGTADPKIRRNGIANAVEQIYYGNIRGHHWNPYRPAICQDHSDTWVRRYTGSSFKSFKEEKGKFTIHIHNPGLLFNSSLGCFITENNTFVKDLKEIKGRLESVRNIPVMWINGETLVRISDIGL